MPKDEHERGGAVVHHGRRFRASTASKAGTCFSDRSPASSRRTTPTTTGRGTSTSPSDWRTFSTAGSARNAEAFILIPVYPNGLRFRQLVALLSEHQYESGMRLIRALPSPL